MKHRGRHRRRRRGRAVRATLAGTALALTAAATLISASQATVADTPGALKTAHRVRRGRPRCRWPSTGCPGGGSTGSHRRWAGPSASGRCWRAPTARCATRPTARPPRSTALPVAPAATRAYCFGGADTRGWRAGAVTTSGDADDDGRWGENRVILSGWTNGGAEGGSMDGPAPEQGLAQVAFVDANDPDRLRYTWALLAVPVDGGRDYRGLVSPLSGMVWYQDKLLVTTREGDRDALYVYDMDRIQRATVESDAVGRVRGGWAAHGYRYRAARRRLRTALPGGDDGPRPAAVSLDRSTSPDSLVASERVPADGDRRTRLWRYALSRDPARVRPAQHRLLRARGRRSRRTRRRRPTCGACWRTARAGTSTARRAHRAGTERCGARTRRAAGRPECGLGRDAPVLERPVGFPVLLGGDRRGLVPVRAACCSPCRWPRSTRWTRPGGAGADRQTSRSDDFLALMTTIAVTTWSLEQTAPTDLLPAAAPEGGRPGRPLRGALARVQPVPVRVGGRRHPLDGPAELVVRAVAGAPGAARRGDLGGLRPGHARRVRGAGGAGRRGRGDRLLRTAPRLPGPAHRRAPAVVRHGPGLGPRGPLGGADADEAGLAAHLQQGRRARDGQLPASRASSCSTPRSRRRRTSPLRDRGLGLSLPDLDGHPGVAGCDQQTPSSCFRDKSVRILDEAGLCPDRRDTLPSCLELELPW